jgi:DNA-binding NtrC family response regulator
MSRPVTALVVMVLERVPIFVRCLTRLHARVLTASNCSEADEFLRSEPAVGLVLTDLVLPDGSWCDVLSRAKDLQPEAEVVVCARLADERLWTEVLDAGGFDVLAEPYQDLEVERIVARAVSGRRLAAAF